MTRDEIITEARERLDDLVQQKYNHSTVRLEGYLTEAMIEACRRSRILINSDESTSIAAGTAAYYMPENMFQILRATPQSNKVPLQFTSYRVLDEDCPGWETDTGTPIYIITDMETDKYILYPIPVAADTLKIMGAKDPLYLEEIPARYHYGLVDWVLFRAYSKRDADTFNPAKSAEHLALFEQEYGRRSSAQDEIFNMRQRPFNNFDGHY